MAYMDGTGTPGGSTVVPLSLARLERMIQVRLAESLELGDDPAITVKVCDPQSQGLPSIPEDPAMYEAVVEKIVSALDRYLEPAHSAAADAAVGEFETVFLEQAQPHRSDRFVGHLRCHDCGAVTTDGDSGCETFLRAESDGTRFTVGDSFTFDPTGVRQSYYVYGIPAGRHESTHIVEGWECPECEAVNWAEIVVDPTERIRSVWSVSLSREVLERAHYVTSECIEVAARLSGRPAWTLDDGEVFEILFERN